MNDTKISHVKRGIQLFFPLMGDYDQKEGVLISLRRT
jgi:hypothetical protein